MVFVRDVNWHINLHARNIRWHKKIAIYTLCVENASTVTLMLYHQFQSLNLVIGPYYVY